MRTLTGLHAIEEFLKTSVAAGSDASTARAALRYSRSSKRIDAILRLAEQAKVKTVRVDDRELSSSVGETAHRGVVLDVPFVASRVSDLRQFISSGVPAISAVLALDGVTDPHNLGAILRSADQFGVDLVLLPARRSARLTDTVFRTSAGAALVAPIVTVANLTRALADLKEAGFWLYGADIKGKSALSAGFAARSVLVLGSEGKGLSRLVAETCDELVRIPSFGTVDSLNVSVAAGVLLYELRRQQGLFSE